MKFIDAEDDVENQMMFRKVSEDGKIEVAIHPVIFGFRVVAGYVGSQCYSLNYCAGNEQGYIELIYSMVIVALEVANGNFKVFPHQNVKPMFNDPECFRALDMMFKDEDFDMMRLPGLHAKKNEMIRNLWKND